MTLVFIVVTPRGHITLGDMTLVFIVVAPRGHITPGLCLAILRCYLDYATEVALTFIDTPGTWWALYVESARAYKFSGVLLAINTLMCVSMLT